MNVLINETHLAVLKKSPNTSDLIPDNLALDFCFSDNMESLRSMSENDDSNVFDMESFINRTDLSDLKRSFNYCPVLYAAYQELGPYKNVNREEYVTKTKVFKKYLDDPSLADSHFIHQLNLRDLNRRYRSELYQEFKQRQLAYTLNKNYSAVADDPMILAHSNRKLGTTNQEFILGNDFKVVFKTNFGYGNSSYFYTNISYKGIDIRPFSDWIRYRYANKAEIIRYTRWYPLENEHWIHAMKFTADSFNHSLNDPATFVQTWIIRECDEMISGLIKLLNSDREYHVKESYFHTGLKHTLTGFDLMIFKGERISGALSFLEKIKELSEVTTQVEAYIFRIMDCNLDVYQQMKRFINHLESQIIEIEHQLLTRQATKQAIEEQVIILDQKKVLIGDELRAKQAELATVTDQQIDQKFLEMYPIFNEYREQLTEIRKQTSDLNIQLTGMRNTRYHLSVFCENIEQHFKSVGDARLMI